jgi:hypothetical protein
MDPTVVGFTRKLKRGQHLRFLRYRVFIPRNSWSSHLIWSIAISEHILYAPVVLMQKAKELRIGGECDNFSQTVQLACLTVL